MQLKALTKSATGMTDEQCETGKMSGLRGGRELTTTQVAKLVSTGWSRVGELTKEVPVNLGCYRAREPAEIAAPRQAGARNDKREPDEIATPRQVGARNDKRAWCWMKETGTKSWRRDLRVPVSSLFLVPVAETSPDFSYRLVCATGQRTGWLGLMNRTTISTHEAFSTRRVPVGRGR